MNIYRGQLKYHKARPRRVDSKLKVNNWWLAWKTIAFCKYGLQKHYVINILYSSKTPSMYFNIPQIQELELSSEYTLSSGFSVDVCYRLCVCMTPKFICWKPSLHVIVQLETMSLFPEFVPWFLNLYLCSCFFFYDLKLPTLQNKIFDKILSII